MTYEVAIVALADPTRRALIERLRAGPLPVCDLAATLPVSRPAVSQHLRVLTEAGLLDVTPIGTRRVYRLAPGGFADLRCWLDRLWDDALAEFAAAARAEASRLRRDHIPEQSPTDLKPDPESGPDHGPDSGPESGPQPDS